MLTGDKGSIIIDQAVRNGLQKTLSVQPNGFENVYNHHLKKSLLEVYTTLYDTFYHSRLKATA